MASAIFRIALNVDQQGKERTLQTQRQARRISSPVPPSRIMQHAIYLILFILGMISGTLAKTRYYKWEVTLVQYTRNCVTKPIVVVNGMYPGPMIDVYEGDRVIVNVINKANANVTIHWHGVRQLFSGWQDGVGYITQCPIQPNDYFVYDFVVSKQHGTTFWHAHVNWIRATVHGAFVTRPWRRYPFTKPYREIPIILGEWWNGDVEVIEKQGLAQGGPFPLADALTINGYPGTRYGCGGDEGLTRFTLRPGKTYLLRIINAALNTEFFFGIADHDFTVVEADSSYTKPLKVSNGILVAPGQTMNVLLSANQRPGNYYAEAKSYSSILITDFVGIPPAAIPFILQDVPPTSATALFQYVGTPTLANVSSSFPSLPESNDTDYKTSFDTSLKNLYFGRVPSGTNSRKLLVTVGTGTQPCTAANPCAPQQQGYRVVGEVNNVTFREPSIAILQAYFFHIPGVYSPTFPDNPPVPYDYTNADSPPNPGQVTTVETRVTMLDFGTVVDLVLQNNNNFVFETHPFHLHGFFFYVLGQGFGNYNPASDAAHFNVYDPPARFTVDVPRRGWVAIRFRADNPGAWFFHCHLDKHLSWGMQMVFIVKNGVGRRQSLPSPPRRLSPC